MTTATSTISDDLAKQNQSDLAKNFDRSQNFVDKWKAGKADQAKRIAALDRIPLLEKAYISAIHFRENGPQHTKLDVTIDFTFAGGQSSSTVADYLFEIPLAEFQRRLFSDIKFANLVALLVMFNFEAPLSVMQDFRQFLDNYGPLDKLTSNKITSDIALTEDAASHFLEQLFEVMHESGQTIAYFAWNDRMTMYRNAVHKQGQLRFAADLNPMCICHLPETYSAGMATTMAGFEKKRALASLSWGKESLLTITLAEELHGRDKMKLGLIQHMLDGDQGYQDAYETYLPGSPLEGMPLSRTKIGYLKLLHSMTPSLLGPTHGLHHIYALAHLINNYDDVDVVYMGDEAERTIANRLYRSKISDFIYTQDDIDAQRYPELRDPASQFQHVGFDHTFDFHQSQYMADCLNGLMRRLNLDKTISSLIYPISEMQIQYLLYKLNPKLFQFQVSCWFADHPEKSPNGSKWCNSCYKCARLAWMMRSLGLDHKALFGIDYHNPEDILEPTDNEGKIFAVDADLGTEARAIVDVGVNFMRFFAAGETTKLVYVLENEKYISQPNAHLKAHPKVLELITEPLLDLTVDNTMKRVLGIGVMGADDGQMKLDLTSEEATHL